MRTFVLVCVVAIIVAAVMAYAVGLVAVSVDQTPDQCAVTVTIDKTMLWHPAHTETPSLKTDGEIH